MQQVYSPAPAESSGKVALREGVIIALILGALHLLLIIVRNVTGGGVVSLLVSLLICLVWLVAFFLAGMRASKRTALVSTGTLAGLWTGIFGGIIGFIINLVEVAISVDTRRQALQDAIEQAQYSGIHYTNQMVIVFYALFGICLLLIGIGLGAGMGALGGLLGRSQSPLRFAAYPQPPFPPPYPLQPGQPYMPPPGQPLYPPTPQPPQSPPYE